MGSDSERFHKALCFVLTFGKHIGKTLEQVCSEDPQYVYWLAYGDKGPKYKLKQEVIKEAQRFGADFAKDKM